MSTRITKQRTARARKPRRTSNMTRAMDEKTYQSLYLMVVYLSADEARHFEECGRPRNHIHRHVMRLEKWLDANTTKSC